MKLFPITEDDLRDLEHVLPLLADDLSVFMVKGHAAAPRVRKQLRQVKEILSNVRWGYGPPLDVEIIPAGEGPPTDCTEEEPRK
jgi:hypothetical protein